jgi:DUF1680 family protein
LLNPEYQNFEIMKFQIANLKSLVSWFLYLKLYLMKRLIITACIVSVLTLFPSFAQSPWDRIGQKPSTLFMGMGEETFTTKSFSLTLVNASQTVKHLTPLSDMSFDYTPSDRIEQRDKDGLYHLGDINITLRKSVDGSWKQYSTAYNRKPVQQLAVNGNIIAAADLAATLPEDIPVGVKRFWETDKGDLVLRFEITNRSSDNVEIGSLGIPLIFNNILEGKNLDQAHHDNVFFDPYIGKDAGYLQVNRLHGKGASLLVLPQDNAAFEAYNPLNDDPTPKGVVFEGFHEWLIHSKANAETEWKDVEPWNEPTSTNLVPGESKNFSIKFVLAPSIRGIEDELICRRRPVAVGLPGYVLPANEKGRLFIKYPERIRNISVYPENALTLTKKDDTPSRWSEYEVKGNSWGRARVTVNYADGVQQTIHYKVIKSQQEVVDDLGNFLTTKQWYENKDDAFGRSPSIMNYDYDRKQILTQERRSWFVGLSDEAGAGSWLAAVMKQLVRPDHQEIQKIKRFINETMWGGIQHSSDSTKYGVRKSLFYYEPELMPEGTYSDSIRFSGWEAWSKENAEDLGRSYNYPHVAAAHWVMYHLGRNRGIQGIDWKQSLENACYTAIAMMKFAPYYAQFGQMEGSVFLYILLDLQREGFTEMAVTLEAEMKKRADHWRSLNYPFGSEMPWDSTGQEEVYMWTSYFGYADKADVTLNAILAYMPALPHWGYNGSARRYWDFVYGGKLARIERQLHHYGSGLNAIPVLAAYRDNPEDFYLLRVGYAGSMGPLANVTEDGFGPAAFHSYPSTLDIDGYAGDYGSGFYGYAVNAGTYIYNHPEFGWVAFSGNIEKQGEWIKTEITTAGRNRVFIASESLHLTTVAGQMEQIDYNPVTKEVVITFDGNALLDLTVPDDREIVLPKEITKEERGYYVIKSTKGKENTLRFKIEKVEKLQSNANSADIRIITGIEPIHVDCPVGTVPRLPYQVLVTYSDGKSEYRQTRWSNSALATELEQADPEKNPVGHEYAVKGFIIGDNTTQYGYPVTATVKVVDETYATPSHIPVANPVPLDKVVIDGDNRLTSNRDLAILQILSWDVSQQLYNYRDTYGLSTEGYTIADGWDSPTTKLKGHGSGHYMSALAFAFASAVHPEHKSQLRDNMRRMVNELRECQERTFVWNEQLGRYWEARDFAPEAELRTMKGTWEDFDMYKTQWEKYGYGYLNAIPAHHPALIEMYRGYNNSDWVWAPYYSIHKQLAGLIDIATYVDDSGIADKALLIAKDMGLWIWNRLHYRTFVKTDGTQEERRANPGNRYEMWNIYIAGEDGGTGESLARLSEMVTDPEEKARLLEASNFFDSPAFYDPLAKNIDDVRTRHANQHIPKITSALRSFRGNNNPYYYHLSENFWNMIQGRYRYATGGVGNGEMFRQPYTQVLSMATNVTSDNQRNLHPAPNINETCCAYNLAKLTKDLNSFNPDDARYMDYYERVLYNQLIGSLHHTCYQTTYQYAVGLNASKPWGNRTPQSTCCGGTGSENHVKYQEAAYFVSENTLWVALYLPTTLSWDAKNVTIQQDCLWPAENSTIRLTKGTAGFAMKLRVPYWATEGFDVKLNGVSVASTYQPGTYVTIPARTWTTSDVVEIIMPFTKHIDFGPDKLEIAATGINETSTPFTPMWVGTLMYGPLAMTATGIDNWEEATIDVDPDLGNIILNRPAGSKTGVNANLYTLTLGDKTFQPDYYRHDNTTHYFRINLPGNPSVGLETELNAIDKSMLEEYLHVAIARKHAQESWNAFSVKVPEYAPWAPHGFNRMMEQLELAENVFNNTDKNYNQTEINEAASALNAAINTMRPGNLPELEDLGGLLGLLTEAKSVNSPDRISALTEAIEYAEMVVKYVGDGSGTHDMIENAVSKLKQSIK